MLTERPLAQVVESRDVSSTDSAVCLVRSILVQIAKLSSESAEKLNTDFHVLSINTVHRGRLSPVFVIVRLIVIGLIVLALVVLGLVDDSRANDGLIDNWLIDDSLVGDVLKKRW